MKLINLKPQKKKMLIKLPSMTQFTLFTAASYHIYCTSVLSFLCVSFFFFFFLCCWLSSSHHKNYLKTSTSGRWRRVPCVPMHSVKLSLLPLISMMSPFLSLHFNAQRWKFFNVSCFQPHRLNTTTHDSSPCPLWEGNKNSNKKKKKTKFSVYFCIPQRIPWLILFLYIFMERIWKNKVFFQLFAASTIKFIDFFALLPNVTWEWPARKGGSY